MSMQSIQKRILSQRQGVYVPEDEIIFDITPSDVAVLVGKNSYFRCEVLLRPEQSQTKCSLDSFGGGGYALFDRFQAWSGGVLLESCEDVPCVMGNKNFYDTTSGLQNQRNLFEGLNNNFGTGSVDTCFSPYYNMPATVDGDSHYKVVELCLPLRFSGLMYGKVVPVIATQGLQLRFLLNSAVKACKSDMPNGFVLQRDRTGRAPLLMDLPFTSAQPTNAAPFLASGAPPVVPASAVKQGPVPQHLPQCWELAVGSGTMGDLAVGNLTGTVILTVPNATAGGPYGPCNTTSSGSGVGCTLNVTINPAATTSVITVVAAGSGYEPGDTLVVSTGITGQTGPMTYTIVAGDYAAATEFTGNSIRIKTDTSAPACAAPTSTAPWIAPMLNATLRANVAATKATYCNLKGQRLYAVNNLGRMIELTGAPTCTGITAVDADTSPDYIEITWDVNTPAGAGTFDPTRHIPVFGAILDPNIVGNRGSQRVSYEVSNPEMVCESLVDDAYVGALMKKSQSGGGISFDIKTYNVHRQNLFKNQVVSQSLIPTTEYRAKSLIHHQQIPYENLAFSYWEPVSDYLRAYQYQIKDKNTPNLKVMCDKEYSPDLNSWNVVLDNERTKALEAAGVVVRRELHPSARFLIARRLSSPGFSFDSNKNQPRLTEDWGISMNTSTGVVENVLPQYNKMLLSFLTYFRKLTIQKDNIVVAY